MRCWQSILLGASIWFLVETSTFAQRELKDIPSPDPELERQTFVVPEGMEVRLYAADPLLAKPIQINFDERGRLWVASSEVYPQIKPGEAAHDKILVLEDTNHDGQADKTTVFADGLLIPTGVIAGDGGAYVVNSTELLHLRDTDQDGRADERRVVLSGFGTEDTHHLLHTLRWGFDGCLYMNQSIYIHSHVETPYGVKRLNGGGIWRFRPETQQLDVLCYGFVNAWGHHQDAWGQSFATDGAYHEGINFVFPGSVFVTAPGAKRFVAGLNPGSPKHCSLEIVSGRHLPDDWQGSMITNDFRAHRVCRFVVSEDGSGYASRQEVEVIKSTHVAFRPIDAKMGPDGALYIADWYNPIIQHGEVDFRDPRRDHVHGRIWRVSAKGRPTTRLPDIANASIGELLDLLKEPEEWVRIHAKLALKRRVAEGESAESVGKQIVEWVAKLSPQDSGYEHARLEALWACQNIQLVQRELLTAVAHSTDHRVRAAAIRVMVEWRDRLPEVFAYFQQAVGDEHPRVRLEAVRALALYPEPAAAQAAIKALDQPMDRFLDFAVWQTMRDLEPVWLPAVRDGGLELHSRIEPLLFALRAVESPAIVPPLLRALRENRVPRGELDGVLELIAAHGGPAELATILDLVVGPEDKLSAAEKAALLQGLVATSQTRHVQPGGDLLRIQPLLAGSSLELRAAAAKAAGAWKLTSLAPTLIGLVTAPDDDPQVSRVARDGAIDGLVLLGGPEAVTALRQLAARGRGYENRQRGVSALASVQIGLAASEAVLLLQDLPAAGQPAEVVGPLLNHKNGAEALIEKLAGQTLPADVAKLALRAIQTGPRPAPELLEAVRKAGNLADTGWKLTPELVQQLTAEVAAQGDAARGESIFRRNDMQCLKCHAIAGAGGRVGSDLISLGATAQVDYIIESLLTPNAKLKEGYHSKLVVTDDGHVITGIPVRENGTELVLRDAEDKEVSIPVSSIEEKKDGRSLMPDGAVDALTRAELVDLVRFLSELGKVGDYAVSNSRLVRRWQSLVWTQEAHQRLNRTSHDLVAGADPALTWQPAYSQVAGGLPIDALPRFQPHKDTPPSSFVRCQVQVTTPGLVKLALNSTEGLAAWLDGKPIAVAAAWEWNLPVGLHTLTLDINQERRQSPLRLELVDVPGSPAQAQLVSGK